MPDKYDAINKWQKENYESIMFNLHPEKDARLIQSIEDAMQNGKSKREWLREIYSLSRR